MPLQGRFFRKGCIRVEKKIKVTILILSILLGLSLLALAGTLIRARLTDSDPGTVTVPDNLITPEEDTGTAGAAGYCSVQVGDEVYYTEPTAPAAPESSEAGPTAAPEDAASDLPPAGREPEES